jgi:DNA repair protein RecO (recombination protein O)
MVVTLYTEVLGRQSFLVQGVYRKKSKFPPTLFQPLTLLEIEQSVSPKRELQRIKEAILLYPYHSIPFDHSKVAIALFLSEILFKTLREEEPNPALFEFVENALHFFDTIEVGVADFHLWFIVNFTRFLGFYPVNNYSSVNCVFDQVNGRFYASPLKTPAQDELLYAYWLNKLLELSADNLGSLALNHDIRNVILTRFTEYYHTHLGHLGPIKSLPVLQGVFG